MAPDKRMRGPDCQDSGPPAGQACCNRRWSGALTPDKSGTSCPGVPGRQESKTGPMELITSTDALAAFCNRATQFDFVTVDTEFLRETTYWPKLCLLQAATPDEAILVDPLADGLSLQPFFRPPRQQEDRKSLPRGPAGHRNLRQALRRRAAEHLRHPDRRLGLRLRRQCQLRQSRALGHRRRSR